MHRMDPVLLELDENLSTVGSDDSATKKIEDDIKNREKTLLPLYTQIAHEFADLHDRAGRMKAKGCINEVLEWKTARGYFYWRIRRRQQEEAIKSRLVAASNNALTLADAAKRLTAVLPQSSDKDTVSWLENNGAKVDEMVQKTRIEFATSTVSKMLEGLSDADVKAILAKLNK